MERPGFVSRPHRTLLARPFPVLPSLLLEPPTGLADTVFIAALGGAPPGAPGMVIK